MPDIIDDAQAREGRWGRLGFYICLNCMRLVIPVNGAPAAKVAEVQGDIQQPE